MTSEPVVTLSHKAENASQSADAWATVASLGYVDYDELPETTHWLWFSCKGQQTSDNEWRARLRDVTNGSTTACISVSATGASVVAADPVSITPSSSPGELVLQLRNPSAGTKACIIPSTYITAYIGEK